MTWREGLTSRRALVFVRDVGDAVFVSCLLSVVLVAAVGALAGVAVCDLVFGEA